MTGCKKMAAALAGVLLFASCSQAVAQVKVLDFSGPIPGEVYRDLPGVVTPEEAEARKKNVSCVRVPSDRSLSGRWRPEDSALYSCTRNGVTVTTNQLPRSRERDLRGIGW